MLSLLRHSAHLRSCRIPSSLPYLRRLYADQPPTASSDPLHYHPLPPSDPERLALSFIDRPPPSANSRTPIGYLPLFADGREPSLSDFVENPAFKDVLHEAIRRSIADGDERIVAEALGRVEGWINLTGTF